MATGIERRHFLQGGIGGALALMLPQAKILEALASEPVCTVGLEHKRETIRALVDTIVPGPPRDPTPGGLAAGIDEMTLATLERWSPPVPIADLLVTSLDRTAMTMQPGNTFKCLTPERRDEAIRRLEDSPSENERVLSMLAVLLPTLLYYSEVGGDTSWPLVGFPGHDVEGWAPWQYECPEEHR